MFNGLGIVESLRTTLGQLSVLSTRTALCEIRDNRAGGRNNEKL